MRLFCRKCDKEIEDFEIKQEECGHISYVDLIVSCHGTQDYIRFHRTKSFNTSDYGDLYFFEGDEPEKEWDVEKCHELFNAMLRRFHDEKNASKKWAGPIPEPIEPEKIKVKWRRYQVADRTYTESYPVIEDCCKTWKRKPLSYNVDEDKWKLLIPTFCPECGKKL
uniref:Uncharacterized protein n=1 Tax=viral metagenome TaxID=1070528 RepID=A0A6M3XIS9_9ZZZZ